MANLQECLPAELRGPDTTITPISVGWSGAAIHRVEAAGQTFVLKLSADRPLPSWRHQLAILQRAADAGVAPRVVHSDEAHRAVVSAFVADRGFPLYYRHPATHAQALAALGQLLRRVHALPLATDATPPNPRSNGTGPREFLATTSAALAAATRLPAFVRAATERVLAADPPACDRAPVLSHNDVNPSNLVYDGEHLLLLDWDSAGGNEPYYDLATIAVFLLMDDGDCRALLAAYDGAPVAALPARFVWDRRLVAVLCGTIFLRMAHERGHAAADDATLESTSGLGELYMQMMSGAVDVATAEGQARFGLALVKQSVTL